MNHRIIVYAVVLWSGSAVLAWAQAGVTVQLPSFHNFSVNTTVSVPTGGGLTLGGVHRGFQRSGQRGVPALGRLPLARPLGVREAGLARTAGATSVRLSTIDLQQLDPSRHSRALSPPRPLAGGMWMVGIGQAQDHETIARRVAEIRRLQLRE